MDSTPTVILPKSDTERVEVSLGEYEGHRYLDIRQRYLANDKWLPTKKGVTVKVGQLPELIAGLQRIETQARAAGLLGDTRSAVA